MFSETMTTENWQTLQFAPFWVGVAVAGADQKPQPEESEVLADELAAVHVGARHYGDPLVQEVLESVARDFASVAMQCLRDPRPVMKGLSDVADVLEQYASEEQADHFKAVMLELGMKTAEAAGRGGLLDRFRKDKVSDEDKAAVVAAAFALKLDMDTLGRLVALAR